MAYALHYYRDTETALRYSVYGGLVKPSGYRVSPYAYRTFEAAAAVADHINRVWRPKYPVTVVRALRDAVVVG